MRNGLFLFAAISLLLGLSVSASGQPVPELPAHFTSEVNDYRVAYDPDPESSNYFPFGKALHAILALDRTDLHDAWSPAGHHAGFLELGFQAPYFSVEPKTTYIYDCKELGPGSYCDNGFATSDRISIPTSMYVDKSESCIRMILGHELFHHIQFAHAAQAGVVSAGQAWTSTIVEGHARAMQNKLYRDLTFLPGASCIAGFNKQVDSYLKNPDQPLWSSSYSSALWWTYLMEQFGSIASRPRLGADFIQRWYEQAEAAGPEGADAIQITQTVIQGSFGGQGLTVPTVFRRFSIANLARQFDLSSWSPLFRWRYTYRDEDAISLGGMSNESVFNNVHIAHHLTIDAESPAEQHFGVSSYGTRYARADISACPENRMIRLEFQPTNEVLGVPVEANPGSYFAFLTREDKPSEFYVKSTTDWTLTTFQPGNRYDWLYIGVSATHGFWAGSIRVSCESPQTILDLDFPLAAEPRPVHGGPADGFAVVGIDVHPFHEDDPRGLIGGLQSTAFEIFAGEQPAEILGGVRTRDGYRLQVRLPEQSAETQYQFLSRLSEAEATAPDALVHGTHAPDVMLAVDTTSGMLRPAGASRLAAMREAGPMLVDLLPEADQMGLVRFDESATVVAPLAAADTMHRNRIRSGIEALESGPLLQTALGAGILAALDQFAAAGAPAQEQHLVLVASGAEHHTPLWSEIRDQVIASGVRIHAIAFGPRADQPLLAEIARATGGHFAYAEVPADGAEVHELTHVWQQVADIIGHRQRFAELVGQLTAISGLSMEQEIIEHQSILGPLVIYASAGGQSGRDSPPITSATLFRPDGSEVIDGVDGAGVRFNGVYYVASVGHQAGTWTFQATGAAELVEPVAIELGMTLRTGDRHLLASVFRPDIGDEILTAFEAGDPAEIQVSLFGDTDGAKLGAEIVDVYGATRPISMDATGEAVRVDDDQSARGLIITRDEILITSIGTAVSTGSASGYTDDPDDPGRRGSYQVKVVAQMADGSTLYAYPDFQVFEPIDGFLDRDGDGLPDAYEERHWCLDPDVADSTLDPDTDGLASIVEFELGTDPCNPDTSGGGETDGSAHAAGRSPLDATTDALPRPAGAHVVTQLSEHLADELTPNANEIHLPGNSAYSNIVLKRGVSVDALSEHAVIPRSQFGQRFVDDQNIESGRTYFYQLHAIDDDGNLSAPGDIFSGTTRSDPAAPLGGLIVQRGLPRTDDDQIRLDIDLYNKDQATIDMQIHLPDAEIIEMPYQPVVWIEANRSSDHDVADDRGQPIIIGSIWNAEVVLIDGDNRSIAYAGGVERWPAGTLGDIAGTIALEQPDAPRGRDFGSNTLIEIVGAGIEAPALTDAAGAYKLSDLMPGEYWLRVSRMGYSTAIVGPVTVLAGEITELAELLLLLETERIFHDRFE